MVILTHVWYCSILWEKNSASFHRSQYCLLGAWQNIVRLLFSHKFPIFSTVIWKVETFCDAVTLQNSRREVQAAPLIFMYKFYHLFSVYECAVCRNIIPHWVICAGISHMCTLCTACDRIIAIWYKKLVYIVITST